MMVGRDVLLRVDKTPAHPGPIVLRSNLQARSDCDLEGLKGEFRCTAGEILGIAGVEGNGQTELVEVLTGMRNSTGGKITLTQISMATGQDKRYHHLKRTWRTLSAMHISRGSAR